MRLDRAIDRSGKLSVVAAGAVIFMKNLSEDIEVATDIVTSWWSPDGWLGTEDEIAESILDDFPGHRVNVTIDGNSITYSIRGRRLDFDCHQVITEDAIELTGESGS